MKNFVYKMAHIYVNVHENFWFKYFIGVLFFGIPFYLLHLCTNAGFRAFVKENFGSYDVVIFLGKHFWIIFLIMGIISFICTKLYSLADYLDKQSIFSDVNKASFNVVWDHVVKAKLNRFDNFLTSKKFKSGMAKSTIFDEITRPDQQFIVLATFLYEYFHEQFKEDFKIRILEIDNGKSSQWLAWAPTLPETDCVKLNDAESSITHCLKKKKMVIIEDVAAEIKKKKNKHYCQTHEEKECGSLICIPCYCHKKKEISSVVVIWCEKKSFFKERERSRISSIADQIQLRVQLEQSLSILKV